MWKFQWRYVKQCIPKSLRHLFIFFHNNIFASCSQIVEDFSQVSGILEKHKCHTACYDMEYSLRPKKNDVLRFKICPKKNDVLLNLACVHVHVGMQQSIST
jgi:hypothetical protein